MYFPGRVVPMLPAELSNDLCSLRPGEPRLTKTVFITYDRRGQVVETELARSVIRSRARLTYEEVSAALDGAATEIEREVLKILRRAEKLAQRIQTRRVHAGMITLSLPEVEIELAEDGHVLNARPADTSFSHTIIEMFMVEANEQVSKALLEAGMPHLRRIHPAPDPGEAGNLLPLVPTLGRDLPTSLKREDIMKLLERVRGQPEETAANYILLRSMPQASYGPERAGHFALASEDYCHFTSPIRRYPDLTVHRALDVLLRGRRRRGGRRAETELPGDAALADLGRAASAAERRALQAERQVQNALLTILMSEKLGQVFDGVITSVMAFGVFVQLRPVLAEGLIRVGDFGADEWDYDRGSATFLGRGTQRLVAVGQQVRVLVADVDLVRLETTLLPADGGPIGVVQRPTAVMRQRRERRFAGRGRRR